MPVYIDLDLNFNVNPYTQDEFLITDVAAAKVALKNLLMTSQGEVLYTPEYGVGINQTLFELLNPVYISYLKRLINNQVTNYIPEIKIIDIQVVSSLNSNSISIIINFYVNLNAELQTFTYSLDRVS